MLGVLVPAAFAQVEGGLRQESVVTMVTGAGLVVQLVLYLLLIPRFGAVGAADRWNHDDGDLAAPQNAQERDLLAVR